MWVPELGLCLKSGKREEIVSHEVARSNAIILSYLRAITTPPSSTEGLRDVRRSVR